jgi:TolB protein
VSFSENCTAGVKKVLSETFLDTGILMKKLFQTATAVLVLLATNALAELQIDITRGDAEATPIAVVPFRWADPASSPFDVAAVVAADLARSGRFAPMPAADMLQKPSKGADIDFSDWRILGTEVVVVGEILPNGADNYMIQFQVFDVFRGSQILGYRLPANRAGLRAAAHRISDMIFEKLTGIKGVAATRIAYVNVVGTPKNPVYRLIVADADGENASVMVESEKTLLSPAWSPDGRRIAYVSFENDKSEVFVQVVRSGARQKVSAREGINSAPAFSPDGKQLALTLSKGRGDLDVYMLDLTSQVLTQLTSGPAIDTEAEWSPDGRWIYFTSDRGGAPQVYRSKPGDKQATRVTFEGGYNARPRVSPDGSRLAVVHNDRGNYRIAVVDLERSYTQVLSDGRLDESPSFAPNGEQILYATGQGRNGSLALVSVDGRVQQSIKAVEGEVREPAWGPFPVN